MNNLSGPARSESGKLARRQEILEAAESLWLERGLKGATLEAVAARVGLGKGTVYSYFDGLEDVKRAVWTSIVRRLDTSIIGDHRLEQQHSALAMELALDLDRDRAIAGLMNMECSSPVEVAIAMAQWKEEP